MIFDSPHYIHSDGYRLATYQHPANQANDKDASPIILVHGWPEMAYSWKNQMGPLSAAGYHPITYDLRGFGRSDAPRGVAHYGIAQMVADLEAVIDASGAKQVILCGHDWGGIIVWHAARMIPDRVRGVISICTPHVRRAPVDPIKIFRKRYGDDHYFVHFNDRQGDGQGEVQGEAETVFARDPEAFFALMFRTTPKNKVMDNKFTYIPQSFERYLSAGKPPLKGAVMPDADRVVYVKGYRRSGFHGGVNLYRNTTDNWELADGLSDRITQPCLMLSPEDDLLLPPSTTDAMPAMIAELERKTIPDCGHWAMWDNPAAINAAIISWLDRRF